MSGKDTALRKELFEAGYINEVGSCTYRAGMSLGRIDRIFERCIVLQERLESLEQVLGYKYVPNQKQQHIKKKGKK